MFGRTKNEMDSVWLLWGYGFICFSCKTFFLKSTYASFFFFFFFHRFWSEGRKIIKFLAHVFSFSFLIISSATRNRVIPFPMDNLFLEIFSLLMSWRGEKSSKYKELWRLVQALATAEATVETIAMKQSRMDHGLISFEMAAIPGWLDMHTVWYS